VNVFLRHALLAFLLLWVAIILVAKALLIPVATAGTAAATSIVAGGAVANLVAPVFVATVILSAVWGFHQWREARILSLHLIRGWTCQTCVHRQEGWLGRERCALREGKLPGGGSCDRYQALSKAGG